MQGVKDDDLKSTEDDELCRRIMHSAGEKGRGRGGRRGKWEREIRGECWLGRM